ncbi:unnamed protein product [Didymodactylos carnosus]|uniref:Uncharacterized protein n=1 Tax=Didymodactylos carnosus TaxID=1234261 RepID=A0A8S2EC07_9BILA|nr:unnamed protein product [Didymodactylos carnosus]CAF3939366.1 unnamed protein product [Didymodactylos carnosus]
MVLNVSFTNVVGKTIQTQLKDDFTLTDFKALIADKIQPDAIEHYRFIANNKDLCLDNETEFDKRKQLIKNGVTIFLLRRMQGGGYIEMSILIDIVINELSQELLKLPKQLDDCIICLDNKSCMKLCCNKICMECFTNYFKTSDLRLKCMVCRNSTREFLPYEQFFKTEDFIRSLYALDEVRDLMKHIDCQICHCGVLMVNETMYSKQKCEQCKRWFCFFCNKDWKEEEMKNDQFTCHNHCVYETKLGYDLVPLAMNSQLHVPSRRCCPKCFIHRWL